MFNSSSESEDSSAFEYSNTNTSSKSLLSPKSSSSLKSNYWLNCGKKDVLGSFLPEKPSAKVI